MLSVPLSLGHVQVDPVISRQPFNIYLHTHGNRLSTLSSTEEACPAAARAAIDGSNEPHPQEAPLACTSRPDAAPDAGRSLLVTRGYAQPGVPVFPRAAPCLFLLAMPLQRL